MIIKHLLSIVVCLLIMTTTSIAQDSTKHTAVLNQLWLKSIVSIEICDSLGNGAPIGTGFLLKTPNNHIALVTAKHVIYENEGKGQLLKYISYRFNRKDGKSILIPDSITTAQLKTGWFRSKTNDVTCRLVYIEVNSDLVNIPYTQFLHTSQIEPGAPLFIIGFPLGLRSDQYATPIVRRASIARVDQDMFLVDGFVYPGNSGGPVIYEPIIQLGEVFSTPVLQGDWFVGMILSEISYVEAAISVLTKRPRVTFEQNSGLSNVLPADKILELLRVPEFMKADEALK